MPGCAAIGCNNRSEKGYTMKCFPRDPALRTLWTQRVCRADWVPSNNSFLCHVHFDLDQWMLTQSGRIKFKRNAVPSIFTITSTRKSPRKRRKLCGLESADSADYSASITALNTRCNRFAGKIDHKSILNNAMRNQSAQQEEIVVSDDDNQVVGKNGVDRDDGESVKISESKVKLEIKSQVESDGDLDDIERKLRWICDGELQSDNKDIKVETIIPEKENGKVVTSGSGVNEKLARSRLNGGATENEKNARETGNRKRRSRYEIMKSIEKNAGAGNPVNGISAEEEKEEKPRVHLTDPQESRFTIKVTGMDEDVSEIVRSLGSEPIFQYNSSNESTRNRNGFITSVISVVDHSIPENDEELVKPKVEIQNSPTAETRTDCDWKGNKYVKKLSVESPNDDESSTNCRQLRKKVKFQEEVIRTLSKQLAERNDLDSTRNKLKFRVGGKALTIKRSPSDDHLGRDNLLMSLSDRLIQLEEINKNLNKQLTDKDQQRKKFELQIRHRDNRIKELNWKLDKAAKYLERAEKNTITYRKKMINMQSALARRQLRDEKNRSRDLSVSMENQESSIQVAKKRCRNEEQNEIEDNAVYETVQDIFDESNDCDDDPSVIDTREDFMREFEGAL